jgi:hypothetical protein
MFLDLVCSLSTTSAAFFLDITLKRSGFEAASFCEKDADHVQALPSRAARACGEDGARSSR